MSRLGMGIQHRYNDLSTVSKLWVWFGVFVVLIILVQLGYGATGRARPFVSSPYVSMAFRKESQIAKDVYRIYDDMTIVAEVRDTTIKKQSTAVGVRVDVDRISKQAVKYPLWQRFIPLSILLGYSYEQKMYTKINDDIFTEYTKKLSPICSVDPINASVSVSAHEDLEVIPAVDGFECTRDQLYRQFKNIELHPGEVNVKIHPHVRKAAVSTKAAELTLSEARRISGHVVAAVVEGVSYRIPRHEIISWLSFSANAKSGTVEVSFDDSSMKEYLARIQKNIYKAPGITSIQYIDGEEVSRQIGASGRGIDMDLALKVLREQLMKGDGEVKLRLAKLKPKEVPRYSYTKSQKGLQALLAAIVKEKGDYAISVRQLSGQSLSGDAAGGKVYTPASTYKLFVAYAVLSRIESGVMRWTDDATSGKDVSACFDTMIIDSDNACAEWFGEKIGWKTITSMLHQVGLSEKTSLYTNNGFVATANDEALFLTKLYGGTLLNKESTRRLLDVMKRQVYRSGVPAGVGGSVVADKVGFLGGLLHDAAIVYGPKGVYVVVIFTNGSSWAEIADAARQIHAFLQ